MARGSSQHTRRPVGPSEFENVVIRTVNGYPVKLQDVARVKLEAQSERTTVRLNGKSSVSVGIIKQATGNPLELAKAVRAAIPKMEKDLPEGVAITIANDNTVASGAWWPRTPEKIQRAQQIAPEIAAVANAGRFVSEPARYRFPHSQRRRYERLRQWPLGLLAMRSLLRG